MADDVSTRAQHVAQGPLQPKGRSSGSGARGSSPGPATDFVRLLLATMFEWSGSEAADVRKVGWFLGTTSPIDPNCDSFLDFFEENGDIFNVSDAPESHAAEVSIFTSSEGPYLVEENDVGSLPIRTAFESLLGGLL